MVVAVGEAFCRTVGGDCESEMEMERENRFGGLGLEGMVWRSGVKVDLSMVGG